ncbi:hypothetical protein FPQ18DRAFT_336286 [Pyronema domesticum]|nr:hypothetical protein FPQ18DRAFT_336286 [Pyronema domesticum]
MSCPRLSLVLLPLSLTSLFCLSYYKTKPLKTAHLLSYQAVVSPFSRSQNKTMKHKASEAADKINKQNKAKQKKFDNMQFWKKTKTS